MTDRTIAAEIAELKTLDINALRARYFDVFGRPSRSEMPISLIRRIVWGIQVQRHGGLSDAVRARLAELDGEIYLPAETEIRLPRGPFRVGTVLSREWRNQNIVVTVTETGFEWSGMPFQSLSAVAHAVTGTKWNGYAFFGLRGRKKQ